MATTPEQSDHTSIQYRLELLENGEIQHSGLESFVGITEKTIGIPFKLKDYSKLVDWSGRIIRTDKRGHIDNALPDLLSRLGLDIDVWKILTTEFEMHFQRWVGSEHIVRRVCEGKGYSHPDVWG